MGPRPRQRCFLCDEVGHTKPSCPLRRVLPDVIVPTPRKSPFLIYALVDPRRPDDYRYIGRSSRGTRRTPEHARAAKRGERNPKADWIRSLLVVGVHYRVVILEETTASQLKKRERWWIKKYRLRLLNLSNGGTKNDLKAAKLVRAYGAHGAHKKLIETAKKKAESKKRQLGRITGMGVSSPSYRIVE